jgi:hypothetical protein
MESLKVGDFIKPKIRFGYWPWDNGMYEFVKSGYHDDNDRLTFYIDVRPVRECKDDWSECRRIGWGAFIGRFEQKVYGYEDRRIYRETEYNPRRRVVWGF